MPKKYVRRTSCDRRQWSEDELKEALDALEAKKMGLKKASKLYGIPCPTLRRRKLRGTFKKLPLGCPGVFSPQNEQLLVKHILRLLREGYALNRQSIRKIAYYFAEELQINHRFNRMTQTAGTDWLTMFLSRNKEIKLINRASSNFSEPYPAEIFDFKKSETYNIVDIKKSFLLLSSIYDKHSIHEKPQNNFMFSATKCQPDETDEEKSFVLIACYNAVGTFLSPVVVFKGFKLQKELLDILPEDTDVYLNNKSSCINSQLFHEWLKDHFVPRKPEGKCVLFFEGHPPYLECKDILKFAEENDVILINFEILTSHFFKSFKNQYDDELSKISKNTLTRVELGRLISKAWSKVSSTEIALTEFKDFGIFPLDKSALPDHCYELYDRSFRRYEPVEVRDIDATSKEEVHNNLDSCNSIEEKIVIKTEVEDFTKEIDDVNVEIKEEIEDENDDTQMDYSVFATEPIFESVLTKSLGINNFYPEDNSVIDDSLSNSDDFDDKSECTKSTQTRKLPPKKKGRSKLVQSDCTPVTQTYKKCFVPSCPNTSLSDMKKVFVKVQLNNIIYKKWAEKYGREIFQSPFIFCENHFDLPNDTSNWREYNKSYGKVNLILKPTALPVLDMNAQNLMYSYTFMTKVGRVLCIRPKLRYCVEQEEAPAIKTEIYEANNKMVCDSHTQCEIEITQRDVSTQIDINDATMRLYHCSLPGCPSTNADTPNKVFFVAPEDNLMMKWSQSLGVSINKWLMSHSPAVHCCEDHFNELDMVDNWEKYKTAGCKVTVNINEDKRKTSKVNPLAKRKKTK